MAFNKTLEKVFYKLGSSNDSDIATATLAGFKLFFIPFATMSDKKATKEQKEYAATRDFLTELIALTTYVGVTREFKRHGTTPLCLNYYKKKAKLIKEGKIPGIDPKMFTDEDFRTLENIDKKSFKSVMLDEFHSSPDKRKATVAQKDSVNKLAEVVEKFKKAFPEEAPMPTKFFAKIKRNFTDLFSSKSIIQAPKELYGNTKLNISQLCIWTLAVFIIPPLCNALLKPVLKKMKDTQEKRHPEFKTPVKTDIYPSHNVQMGEVSKNENRNPVYGKVYNIGNMRVGM